MRVGPIVIVSTRRFGRIRARVWALEDKVDELDPPTGEIPLVEFLEILNEMDDLDY